jgi:hypothetical protein
VCAADDGEADTALLFSLDGLGSGGCAWRAGAFRLALDAAEFFTVCEDEVHVLENHVRLVTSNISGRLSYLIECQHLPNQLSSINHGGSHAVVDLALCKYEALLRRMLDATHEANLSGISAICLGQRRVPCEGRGGSTYHLALLVRCRHRCAATCLGTSLMMLV